MKKAARQFSTALWLVLLMTALSNCLLVERSCLASAKTSSRARLSAQKSTKHPKEVARQNRQHVRARRRTPFDGHSGKRSAGQTAPSKAKHRRSSIRSKPGSGAGKRARITKKRGESPEEEPVAKSEETTSSLVTVYKLYDSGLNAELLGNNGLAVHDLSKSASLIHDIPARSDGKRLTMEALINFDLARAAEADGQLSLSKSAYVQCLRANPHFINASISLASLLLRTGEPLIALIRAREAVEQGPQDPRAHLLLSLVLKKNGFLADAMLESQRAKTLGSKSSERQILPLTKQKPPDAEAVDGSSSGNEEKAEEKSSQPQTQPQTKKAPEAAIDEKPNVSEPSKAIGAEQDKAVVRDRIDADGTHAPLPGQ